jgi:GNAT superfamily N-acetyltransferase
VAAIRPAVRPKDWDTARALFRAYEQELDASCCFEGFEQELARLERTYAPPDGRLLLLEDGGEPVGCAAFRVLAPGVAEGKRLSVRPAARGKGLGGALLRALLDEARAAGIRTFRLETLPAKMPDAVALYRRLGFTEIPPYVERPIAGALYLELQLEPLQPPR